MGAGSVDKNILETLTGNINGGARFQYGDGPNLDGNGRLRIAPPVNRFKNKNIHSKNDNLWEEPIVGAIIVHGAVTSGPFQVAELITGGTSGTVATVIAVDGGSLTITYNINHNDFQNGETITGGTSGATAAITTHNTGSHIDHDRNTSSAILQVGQSIGDKAVRQSHRYITYLEGENQHITETFVIDQDSGGDLAVVRRTKTSGSVVDNVTNQADWGAISVSNPKGNGDTLDGSGPSKLIFDILKDIYFVIDFQWQGSGRVRWGLEVFGEVLYFHEENFTNVISDPFMSTPSLPVRYSIRRTADEIIYEVGYFDDENGLFFRYSTPATAGLKTMREVCTAVVSEGGEMQTGLGFAESHDIAPRTVGTTLIPILAVRLKNTVVGGGDNRKTLEYRGAALFVEGNSNAHYHVARLHDPSAITATWGDVGGGSEAEISKDISAVTGNPLNTVEEGYAAGAGGSGKSLGQQDVRADLQDQHHLITQNFDSTNSEILILYAQAHTGTATAYGVLAWIEYE